MQIFDIEETKDISTMIVIDTTRILTGHKDGTIRAWTIQPDARNEHRLSLNRTFRDDVNSNEIHSLTLLPNDRFIASYNSSYNNSTLNIWNIRTGQFETSLDVSCGSVSLTDCRIAAFPNGLIAVSGYVSPAWGAFDVWDTKTGRCLFKEQARSHRPGNLEMTTVKGYLAVHPRQNGDQKLSIWKITPTECTQVSICRGQAIYAMTSSPVGEIITAGFSLNFYTISQEGKVIPYQSIHNTNAIDTIIPLNNEVAIIDRQHSHSGTIKICHPATAYNPLMPKMPSLTELGRLGGSYDSIYLASSGILLWHNNHSLCSENLLTLRQSQSMPIRGNFEVSMAQVKKNIRILAQGYRTVGCAFASLSVDLITKICLFSAHVPEDIDTINFSKNYFNNRPTIYGDLSKPLSSIGW